VFDPVQENYESIRYYIYFIDDDYHIYWYIIYAQTNDQYYYANVHKHY
jgi:hypothetical protein